MRYLISNLSREGSKHVFCCYGVVTFRDLLKGFNFKYGLLNLFVLFFSVNSPKLNGFSSLS